MSAQQLRSRRHHPMPFGAEALPDGRVRFRLWAPDAERVELAIELPPSGEMVPLTMAAEQEGWHGAITDRASPGTLYRYRIEGGAEVPDPASRYQPFGVHGPSQVVDSRTFQWRDIEWRGRPWEEAVLYEMHVGTFTPQGTFRAARERLPYLAELGITAIELMPVAAFAGAHNWGYDGVLPFAPHAGYGEPDDLRAFVEAAHLANLMVLLDVVYNHFGPEGNFLHLYASDFFTDRHTTPWGAAINFDGRNSETVRSFFVHNALYWLDEYHFDGLRLDAVHAIVDDSKPDIIEELAQAVAQGPGRERQVHLVLENYHNAAHYLRETVAGRRLYSAQWNDDFHHACHALLTGERQGYYADYADRPVEHLLRCLCEGFAYQGERSRYRDRARGEPTREIPLTAFISFLQNHDQIGNRPFGERLLTLANPQALRAVTSVMLLAPSVPALFMGEELGCRQPFLYFADFEGDLAEAVRAGRLREYRRFAGKESALDLARLPDPISPESHARSVLHWEAHEQDEHREWLAYYRALLDKRRRFVVPRVARAHCVRRELLGERAFEVLWRLADGAALRVLANLSEATLRLPADRVHLAGQVLHREGEIGTDDEGLKLGPWAVEWRLEGGTDADIDGEEAGAGTVG